MPIPPQSPHQDTATLVWLAIASTCTRFIAASYSVVASPICDLSMVISVMGAVQTPLFTSGPMHVVFLAYGEWHPRSLGLPSSLVTSWGHHGGVIWIGNDTC
jgi:hypothetical protein